MKVLLVLAFLVCAVGIHVSDGKSVLHKIRISRSPAESTVFEAEQDVDE